MTARVQSLWRYPIKSHGREDLTDVVVEPGKCLPWDRKWAVAHEASKATNEAWARCGNFTRVAGAPKLAAITAKVDETSGQVTLHHPERPDITFDPAQDAASFIAWVRPLMPENRAQPTHLIHVPGRGMTDTDFPSVSLCNTASHRAVEERVGKSLSQHRWRGNIWIDGLALWEEFEWVGKDVQVGEVTFSVRDRADRCEAPSANPETGARDADILAALDHWGHQDFSVWAEVTQGGRIAVGDPVTVL